MQREKNAVWTYVTPRSRRKLWSEQYDTGRERIFDKIGLYRNFFVGELKKHKLAPSVLNVRRLNISRSKLSVQNFEA